MSSCYLIVPIILIVQRDDVMFLGEGPPPPESLPCSQLELLVSFLHLDVCDVLDDVCQGAGGPPVEGMVEISQQNSRTDSSWVSVNPT